MGIVNTVPELRATKGMTQNELALALGVSRQTINSVERGRFEPSLSLALAIAQHFSCPFEQVFMFEA